MKGLKFDRLFFKFLVSYLLVLLIPVLCINGLFGYRFMKSYQKEVQSQVNVDVTHLGDLIDMEIQTLSTTVDQMYMFMDFSTYHFNDNPLDGRIFIKHLSVYSTTNPFISHIALYLRGEDYMFIGQSTCQVDFFVNQLYQFADVEPETFREMMLNGEKRIILPEQMVYMPGKSAEYMTVLQPIYTDYQTVRGTSIFFIETDFLKNMVDRQLGKYDAVFSMRDEEGKLLYVSDKILAAAVGEEERNGFFISEYISPESGWRYTAYVPKNQHFMERIHTINQELLLTTVLVLLVTGVLISVMMRMNYSPIHKLGKKASSMMDDSVSKGELETISSTLDFLSDRNQYLSDKLENNAAVVKSSRLHRLLTGHYMSREDFNLDVEDLNLGYENDLFFVAVVQIHGKIEDYDKFALYVQEVLSESMESFYTFTPEPDKIIWINGIEKGKENLIESQLDKMRVTVREEYHIELTVGVGGVYLGTMSIPKSYLEARSALDYRFVRGNGSIIQYQSLLDAENFKAPYLKQQFEQIKNAVSASDQERIHQEVSSLADYIQSRNPPLFVAKGICFDLLSLFTQESGSLRYIFPQSIEVSDLMRFNTVDDIIGLIQKLDIELVPKAETQSKQENDILLEEIKAYIYENCLRCDFSIQETAEHFHMLLPNLSQFFKDKTGQNVLDFSTDFRMKKAKELLEDGKLTLKEISQQVGYYNVSSFIRRFKQLNGMTPGDYRKLIIHAVKNCED